MNDVLLECLSFYCKKKTEIDFLIAVKAKRDFKRDVYQENHTSYN